MHRCETVHRTVILTKSITMNSNTTKKITIALISMILNIKYILVKTVNKEKAAIVMRGM